MQKSISQLLKFTMMENRHGNSENVMEELKWEPFLKASEIRGISKRWHCNTFGKVDHYSKRLRLKRLLKK